MLVLGDSVAFGIGCLLGDRGTTDHDCPPQPGFTTWNGTLGACNLTRGFVVLQNRTAQVDYNCHDWDSRFKTLVDEHDPKLVVINTSGWEIVDRWTYDAFPSGCVVTNVYPCSPPPDVRWGDPAVAAATEAAYASELRAVIELVRYRHPTTTKVLVVNGPYIAPPGPSYVYGKQVWYEAYPQSQPADWMLPNAGVTYRSSKPKIDQLNAAIAAVKATYYANDPNVVTFDMWRHFAPPDPTTGDNEYSVSVCPAPDDEQPLSTCAGSEVVAREADGNHITSAGYQLLGYYLLPVVRQLLGLQ